MTRTMFCDFVWMKMYHNDWGSSGAMQCVLGSGTSAEPKFKGGTDPPCILGWWHPWGGLGLGLREWLPEGRQKSVGWICNLTSDW